MWLWEGQGEEGDVSLTWQETKKMSNITIRNTQRQRLHGAQVVQGTYSLIDWIILAYRRLDPMRGTSLDMQIPGNLLKSYKKFVGNETGDLHPCL